MSAISEALNRSNKPSSGQGRAAIPSLWRGRVIEAYSDRTVAALVPSLLGTEPVRMPSAIPGVEIGDRIIVGAIEGRTDDLVAIMRG